MSQLQQTATEPVQDLLDFEDYHIRASFGKRFLNYIIDLALFYLLFFMIAFILGILYPPGLDFLAGLDEMGPVANLVILVWYGLYMSVVEGLFKGRSLGKLITRTRAVNLDGSPISSRTAFARGFSRAVPFCVFSALGAVCNPWQDRWTGTMVVEVRR
jgi:uncharacterized RDD family membrane protein YckC